MSDFTPGNYKGTVYISKTLGTDCDCILTHVS